MMQTAGKGMAGSAVSDQTRSVAGFHWQLGSLPAVFTLDTNVVGGSSPDVQDYVSYGTR